MSSFIFLIIIFIESYKESKTNINLRKPKATSGTCGDSLSFLINSDTLTISGTGGMTDYTFQDAAPWFDDRDPVSYVVIENGATTIGSCAFYKFDNLISVDIPNTVTIIGPTSFRECTLLSSITIPDSVEKIGEYAFNLCESF